MESWTMTEPALSGARGHSDGGHADAALPKGESGIGKGEAEVGRKLAYLTSQHAPLSPRKARKGAKFRGNKATMWFRMSDLTQKWPKNKANRFAFA